MKNIIYILFLVTGTIVLNSCESKLMLYDGETGVYFAMPSGSNAVNADTTYTETSSLPFVIQPNDVTEYTFNLKIKILGAVADHDRTVTVRMITDESSVLPADFEPLKASYTLKAGTVFGNIPIRFYRAGLKDQERTMVVELIPNDDFSLPITRWRNSSTEYVSAIKHTITVSDKYVQLPGYAVGHFGKFSRIKMELICELSGKDLAYFNQRLPIPETRAIGQKLDRYLKEQNPPLKDEDGEIMKAGDYLY
jgi:hypothetical protein